MKKSERIALNIAALALAHIIMAFLNKMSQVHRPYIVISALFGFVYYFLLVQMVCRNRVVFSKQLFDGESPWYKQLGIVKILLLFAADVVISSASRFLSLIISSYSMMSMPSPDETFLPSVGVWSYVIIWMTYMAYYLILAGKKALSRKKTSLLIMGVTLAATVIFCFVENSIHINIMNIENSLTQYAELLEYSNTTAAMRNVLNCLMACVIVVFCEMDADGKESVAEAEAEADSALSLDDNWDNADTAGGDIAQKDNKVDIGKDDVSENSVNGGN